MDALGEIKITDEAKAVLNSTGNSAYKEAGRLIATHVLKATIDHGKCESEYEVTGGHTIRIVTEDDDGKRVTTISLDN